ncbi:FliM/FliN family flagellar motor switch protein [Candidatus Hydrogenedentota bacterium]
MPIKNGEDAATAGELVAREELDASHSAGKENRRDLAFLSNVMVNLSADLGSSNMKVRDVLGMKKGTVLVLDRAAGEMGDIFVNGIFLSKAEIVALAETFALRLSDFVRSEEEMLGQVQEEEEA